MKKNPIEIFNDECKERVRNYDENNKLKDSAYRFIEDSAKVKYSYNFKYLGVPIIQYPQDIIALQEIIWNIKPDLIIETGIAYGGSLIFYASMLELLGKGKVLGIDIEIREHNRKAIENHSLFKRIEMIENSSIDKETIKKITEFSQGFNKIMVVLDANHTYSFVLKELELYSKLVSVGSYLVVLDTIIEDLPEDFFTERPFGKDNNPKKAVKEFLIKNKNFKIDKDIENKVLITVAPDGYLKRIK